MTSNLLLAKLGFQAGHFSVKLVHFIHQLSYSSDEVQRVTLGVINGSIHLTAFHLL